MLSHNLDMLAHDVERATHRRLDERRRSDPERGWAMGRVMAPARLPDSGPWWRRLWRLGGGHPRAPRPAAPLGDGQSVGEASSAAPLPVGRANG